MCRAHAGIVCTHSQCTSGEDYLRVVVRMKRSILLSVRAIQLTPYDHPSSHTFTLQIFSIRYRVWPNEQLRRMRQSVASIGTGFGMTVGAVMVYPTAKALGVLRVLWLRVKLDRALTQVPHSDRGFTRMQVSHAKLCLIVYPGAGRNSSKGQPIAQSKSDESATAIREH